MEPARLGPLPHTAQQSAGASDSAAPPSRATPHPLPPFLSLPTSESGVPHGSIRGPHLSLHRHPPGDPIWLMSLNTTCMPMTPSLTRVESSPGSWNTQLPTCPPEQDRGPDPSLPRPGYLPHSRKQTPALSCSRTTTAPAPVAYVQCTGPSGWHDRYLQMATSPPFLRSLLKRHPPGDPRWPPCLKIIIPLLVWQLGYPWFPFPAYYHLTGCGD